MIKNTIKIVIMSLFAFPMMTIHAYAEEKAKLSLSSFVGRLDIETGKYDKISVESVKGNYNVKPHRIIDLDGRQNLTSVSCNTWNKDDEDLVTLKLAGEKSRPLEDFPLLKIKAPRNVRIEIKNSVIFGRIDDVSAADLDLGYCGDLVIGNISGSLRVNIKGSADLKTGQVDEALLVLKGSGDVEMGDVAGGLTAENDGAGDIQARRIGGFLSYTGTGSGDFEAEALNGRLDVDMKGSGDVTIDNGDADSFKVSVYGSGDMDFGGRVHQADITLKGSGDIYVYRIEGKVLKDSSGSGRISVGNEQDKPIP